jgi:chromosome segregation ATPase
MQAISIFRAVILLAAVALVGVPAYAQQEQQPVSVAEAARRARAQKKTTAKPVKVLTDDELARKTPANTAAAAQTPEEAGGDKTPAKKNGEAGGGAGAKGEGKEAAGGAAKDEKYWRARFQKAHENLARAEKELDVLQRESSKAQLQNYDDPNKAMQEQYARKEINEKLARIEAKKKEIEDLRNFISKLEDELRMSGGDSGWAR